MARLIGTAGHVDHGKTTLIRALTGIDADRLPEEKARGMTIDVGFAFVDLPRHGKVSIVDVPGHERFLHNMLVGALGIDVAVLCVAADEGVMPQTREHLDILRLLPVEQLVVALTRSDLVDAETLELAELDVRETLEPTRFANSPIVPVSATVGSGLPELVEAISRALDGPEAAADGLWYLPIDRAFAVKGHGAVVTGTMARGDVQAGERAFLEPGHIEVRVRAIHSHDQPVSVGEHGRRIALNLGGIKVEHLSRGMAVGAPGALFETSCFDGKIEWIAPHKHGQRVRVSLGAAEVLGKAFLNDHDPSLVQLRLDHPVAAALNQPFILRRHSPMDVLGGGTVAVPVGKPRKKSEVVSVFEADNLEEAILRVVAPAHSGAKTEEVCRVLGQTPQALGNAFESLGGQSRLFGFAGLWFSPEGFADSIDTFLAALRKLHEDNPQVGLQPRDRVAALAGLDWTGKPFDRILSRLAEDRVLIVEGASVRDPDFAVQLTDKQRTFLDRVKEAICRAGINVPSPHEIAQQLSVPPQAVEEIVRLGIEARELVRIAEGITYTQDQLEGFKSEVRKLGSPFAASDFRDVTGSTRKYVIPLLEYFDATGFTMRQGDKRIVK